MDDYVFGANIIENLTTGMYRDSRVIYREYIQNACDQIDIARSIGLLSDGADEIYIQLDESARIITITDNATGIPGARFRETLANIADSNKHIGEAKGFRGIGRLCGLAYCRELVFSSKAAGENEIYSLRCDAEKMRVLIDRNNRGEKITASEILNQIYTFQSPQKTKNTGEHWFKVELIDVNPENRDLLDFQNIKDYLSFVAPVPYQNTFIYRGEVYRHAEAIGCPVCEYNVYLNGEQVFKQYKTRFKTSKGEDEIFAVQFKDFYDDSGELIASSWFGLSQFKAVISKECAMRGLRLRKENLQIGDDDALKKLFKEDRGCHYFVGEVFAVAKNLIPNSQRDYFNENEGRVVFERCIKRYFNEVLTKLYRDGSAINSAFGKIESYEKKETEFHQKEREGTFIDDDHREKAKQDLDQARILAAKASQEIEKKKEKSGDNPDSPVVKIIDRIENERRKKTKEGKGKGKVDKPDKKVDNGKPGKTQHRTDKLTSLSGKERKLVSRIFSVIISATDENTAEAIIQKIEEELK